MAKGKSSRGNAHGTPSSLTSLLSPSHSTTQPSLVSTYVSLPTPAEVLGVVDRRTYSPTPYRTIASPRRAARLVPDKFGAGIRNQNMLPSGIQFANPKRVAICLRRKARREVLHALKLTRKSGRGGSRRNRNLWSTVKC